MTKQIERFEYTQGNDCDIELKDCRIKIREFKSDYIAPFNFLRIEMIDKIEVVRYCDFILLK